MRKLIRPFLGAMLVSLGAIQPVAAADLATATIADLNAAFDAGVLSSEKLVSLYLARIEAYDHEGPQLGSMLALNPKALEQARALDAERREKGPRSPLHGMVVVAKDVFDTYDMPSTGGFAPMANSQPDRDAFVVERLRDAGAVILGKNNLADWYGRSEGSGSTLGGEVRNPYDITRYAGASSSGSGVAAAAWFATVALGSDTGGSLLIPAAVNSVVALSPTRGLVSRRGMMWNSPRQEKGGPMTRSVYDAAAVLDVIAGFDPGDLSTSAGLGKFPSTPYVSYVDPDGLRGARIGVLREMVRSGPRHTEGNALFEKALEDLRKRGAIVMDVRTGLDIPALQGGASSARFESAMAADAYLSTLPAGAPFRSLQEMLDKAGDAVSPYLAEGAANLAIDRDPQFLASLRQQDMLRDALVALLEQNKLDALVLPYRTVHTAVNGADLGGPGRDEARNGLHAYTGLPALLVPGGKFPSDNMPFSLEFIARPFDEPALIRVGSGYEAATRHRYLPKHVPALPGESWSLN